MRFDSQEGSIAGAFVLGGGLAIILGLAAVSLFLGLLAVQQWRWARRSGYPGWVLVDVFCDTRRDTGTLVNGTGDFALVPGPTRNVLISLRRVRYLSLVLACGVALVAVAMWARAWTVSVSAAQGTAMLWSVPIFACYFLFFLLALPEWRVRRSERARVTGRTSGENVPPVKGELVQMWMASAERARKSLTGTGKKSE